MIVLATSACTDMVGSKTEDARCTALREALFNMRTADTEESKIGYADFLDVFEVVCPDE